MLKMSKGLVRPANGYITEGKRTSICRIWLSGEFFLSILPLKALTIGVWSVEATK